MNRYPANPDQANRRAQRRLANWVEGMQWDLPACDGQKFADSVNSNGAHGSGSGSSARERKMRNEPPYVPFRGPPGCTSEGRPIHQRSGSCHRGADHPCVPPNARSPTLYGSAADSAFRSAWASPLASMRITHPHSPGLQRPTDGMGINIEPTTNASQRPAFRVQTFRKDDVVVGKPLTTHGNTLTVKVRRDRRPVDTEPIGEGINCLPALVGVDQDGDLLRRKLPRRRTTRPDRSRSVAGSHFWCAGYPLIHDVRLE